MLTPDEIAADEKTREYLSATAALAGHFAEALRAAGVPDVVAHQLTIDWHDAYITGGVAWEADEPG